MSRAAGGSRDGTEATMTAPPPEILIVYAPNSDEQEETSAAKEYAARAKGILEASFIENSNTAITAKLAHLPDWDASTLQPNKGNDSTETPQMLLFLISCGRDGTVHRSVRKLTKNFKETIAIEKSNNDISNATIVAMGLLGHSICKTSAEQMADQIFSAGRKLCKLLSQHSRSSTQNDSGLLRFETQVELEAPETQFVEWIGGLSKWLHKY